MKVRITALFGLSLLLTVLPAVTSTALAVPMCRGLEATIIGTVNADVLEGTPERDVIVGLAGADVIRGMGGNDVICGGSGNDRLEGNGGRDILDGGNGKDRLIGGPGNDKLFGGRNADRLWGRGGKDVLKGERGNDTLRGGGSADRLYGGSGSDGLIGGAGNDRCFDGESHSGCELATWSTIVITGSGDDVVTARVPGDDLAVVEFSYSGPSNFAVWSLDANLDNIDLLVNEIGSYFGRRPVNTGEFGDAPLRHLDITASAGWTVTIRSLLLADRFSDAYTGSGDDVIRVAMTGIADFTHNGSSNFAIWARDVGGDRDLLVNEIGSYVGAKVVPSWTDYLDVTADGEWTVNFR